MQGIGARLTLFARANPWSCTLGASALLALTSCSGPVSRLLHFRATHEPKNCIVVITGCDSGMGKSIADILAARGYCVIAICLTSEGAKRLTSGPTNVITLVGDVTKDKDVRAIGDKVGELISSSKKALKLWAVINNAGVAPCGFTDWLDMDTVKQVMDVNYFGVVAVSKVCLPYLKEVKGSRIINISSLAGLTSGAHLGIYSASKHALEGWAKAFRAEVAPFGIAVANVNSGFLKTPLINSSLDQALRLYHKRADHHALYDEKMCHFMADRVRSINEDPACVVNLVCDFLVCKSNPPLRNFAGWQAFGMRWLLMLPQSLVDAAGSVMTPLHGVNTEMIRDMQRNDGPIS